ncbi:endo-1,4-beta-xylanase [Pelagicoccus mobilis]|uniref:Beta-xylanase n=1 Tax=Pelagicoccus mobilis TaxID=415221 RepID=A0A934VPU6_9BACT|nr:endo-1,4-beta-xylanase [Pelagicoccus mobilis]MBK1877642.1 endo-1,4-beta-xylanase [Pelagicoccus mobilis]
MNAHAITIIPLKSALNSSFLAVLFFALFGLEGILCAKTPVPAGGVSLLQDNPLSQSGIFWQGSHEGSPVASSELVQVDHPDFNQALRVTVSNPAGQYWNGAIQLSSNQAVSQGDTLFIRLFFRSIESKDESGVGFATVFPQGPAPDYNKYVTREVTAGTDWVEYLFPFEISEDQPAGSLSLQVGAGAGAKTQIWEVGGIEFLNYRDTQQVADLPISRPTYAGREPDAAWRTAAAERIEKYRKGDFSIQILDTDGSPISNADIEVEFQRHAYHFGSVIAAGELLGNSPDSETYREKFLELFNQSGPENDTKWGPWAGEWEPGFSQQQTLEALTWLKERDIYSRGHVLVWPSKRNLPNLMQSYLPEGDPASADPAAKQVVLDHIDDATSKTRFLVDEWDVLNEPYDNHYLMDAFGDQVMVDWFKQARANLPRRGLYINDYGIISAGGRDFAHQQHLEDVIEYLLLNDAPVTGIGMQGHFSSSPTSIELVYNIFERFHNAFPDLDIRITELDITTDDEDMQADYTRDILTIAFSHPATVGVQVWGFWEGRHWRPSAAMYTQDWREKPNATIWRQLTQETWWNDFAGTTNAKGQYSNRGFYGDYIATIQTSGDPIVLNFTLVADGPNHIVYQLGDLNNDSFDLSTNENTATIVENDGNELILEKSTDLENWTPTFKLKNHTPGAQYSFPIETDSRTFFRLVDETP